MKAEEMLTLQKFFKHLILDEQANGSDEIAEKLETLVNGLVPWNTVEDAAEQMFTIYFDHAVEMLDRWEEHKK